MIYNLIHNTILNKIYCLTIEYVGIERIRCKLKLEVSKKIKL